MTSTKVLLDTDIGSDIDDAVCLAYLLAHPQCELLGITTVTGESVQRAMLASALCTAADRADIPIFPGTEQPLLEPQAQLHAPQAAALDRWPHATVFPRGEAVEFLARTIRAQPGEVTLLAIGPLTNVGLLFAEHPDVAALLKGLMLMCGAFTGPAMERWSREWNARVDPHATAIVYRTPVAVHRSVGLDVTAQVWLDAAKVRERFHTGLLWPVVDMAEVWFQRTDRITFHDPLAAAAIFTSDVCRFRRGTVSVELVDQTLLGKTDWHEATDGPHEVALEVDDMRFFAHFFAICDATKW